MPTLKYKGRIIRLPYTKKGQMRARALLRKGARRVLNYKNKKRKY